MIDGRGEMETTLTFTDEEICCLESMFEVLVEGDGEYVNVGPARNPQNSQRIACEVQESSQGSDGY